MIRPKKQQAQPFINQSFALRVLGAFVVSCLFINQGRSNQTTSSSWTAVHATGKCPVILALAQKEEESIGTSDQDQRILDTIYEEAFEKKRLMVIYGRYLVAALKNRYTYDDILNAAWIRFAEKLQEGALSGFDHESALRYFAGIFRNIIFSKLQYRRSPIKPTIRIYQRLCICLFIIR